MTLECKDKFSAKGALVLWCFALLMLSPFFLIAIAFICNGNFIRTLALFYTPINLNCYFYGSEPASHIAQDAFLFLASVSIIVSAAISVKLFCRLDTTIAKACNLFGILSGAALSLGFFATLLITYAHRYFLAGYTPLRVAGLASVCVLVFLAAVNFALVAFGKTKILKLLASFAVFLLFGFSLFFLKSFCDLRVPQPNHFLKGNLELIINLTNLFFIFAEIWVLVGFPFFSRFANLVKSRLNVSQTG